MRNDFCYILFTWLCAQTNMELNEYLNEDCTQCRNRDDQQHHECVAWRGELRYTGAELLAHFSSHFSVVLSMMEEELQCLKSRLLVDLVAYGHDFYDIVDFVTVERIEQTAREYREVVFDFLWARTRSQVWALTYKPTRPTTPYIVDDSDLRTYLLNPLEELLDTRRAGACWPGKKVNFSCTQ